MFKPHDYSLTYPRSPSWELRDEKFYEVHNDYVTLRLKEVDSAIAEYILFKYKIDMTKLLKNTNNLNFKYINNFNIVSFSNGTFHCYDNDSLFLSYYINENLYTHSIHKHWLEEGL
jgi:hypothetical protein